MKNNSYDSKSREATVENMENLLRKLQKSQIYLTEVNKKLKEIDKDLDAIEDYYQKEWIDDYEDFQSGKIYDVLSQDILFDCLQEIHHEKLKIVKSIVKRLK